jgi:hypothetical protein
MKSDTKEFLKSAIEDEDNNQHEDVSKLLDNTRISRIRNNFLLILILDISSFTCNVGFIKFLF